MQCDLALMILAPVLLCVSLRLSDVLLLLVDEFAAETIFFENKILSWDSVRCPFFVLLLSD